MKRLKFVIMVSAVQILTVASGADTSNLHRDSALGSADSDSIKVHVVEPGETLADIAFAEYGEPSFMGVIQLCNDLPDRDRIFVGQRIHVPSLGVILNERELPQPTLRLRMQSCECGARTADSFGRWCHLSMRRGNPVIALGMSRSRIAFEQE